MRIKLVRNHANFDTNDLERLAQGGEGVIYKLPNTDSCLKIYHQQMLQDQRGELLAAKLRWMVNNPPDNIDFLSWPNDVVVDRDTEQIVGYKMPFIDQAHLIYKIYNPHERQRNNLDFDLRRLVRLARNISIVFSSLHGKDYIVGDISQSNILVRPDATVVLIDNDSFQIRDSEQEVVYPCKVGNQEYTAPELIGVKNQGGLRTSYQDCFGMAVIIFRLLMAGIHPFRIQRDNEDLPPVIDCIKNGWFPFVQNERNFVPTIQSPSFDLLSPSLQEMFTRSFRDSVNQPAKRPTAQEWQRCLTEFEGSLVVCGNDRRHYYGGHLARCPECERSPNHLKASSSHSAIPTEPMFTPNTSIAAPITSATIIQQVFGYLKSLISWFRSKF